MMSGCERRCNAEAHNDAKCNQFCTCNLNALRGQQSITSLRLFLDAHIHDGQPDEQAQAELTRAAEPCMKQVFGE
jgi:hypothetical protein